MVDLGRRVRVDGNGFLDVADADEVDQEQAEGRVGRVTDGLMIRLQKSKTADQRRCLLSAM